MFGKTYASRQQCISYVKRTSMFRTLYSARLQFFDRLVDIQAAVAFEAAAATAAAAAAAAAIVHDFLYPDQVRPDVSLETYKLLQYNENQASNSMPYRGNSNKTIGNEKQSCDLIGTESTTG